MNNMHKHGYQTVYYKFFYKIQKTIIHTYILMIIIYGQYKYVTHLIQQKHNLPRGHDKVSYLQRATNHNHILVNV